MFRFGFFRQEPVSIKTGEIHLFLRGKFDNEIKATAEKLYSQAAEIKNNFYQIADLAASLKSKSSSDHYSNTVKDRFCSKSIQAIGAIPELKKDYESLRKFIALSGEAIQMIGGMSLKEFRHLHLFRDDMIKIAEKIKLIESRLAESQRLIKDSVFGRIDGIEKSIMQLQEAQAKIDFISSDISELKKKSSSIGESLNAKNEAVENLSRELSEYADEKLKIRELERREDSLYQKISEEFSGLGRTLKKFKYYGDLNKEQLAILKEYIRNPAHAFIEIDRTNAFKDIIDMIFRYKDRKVIELDERKVEKIKDLLRRFDLIVSLKDHYNEIRNRKELLEKDISNKMDPISKSMKGHIYDADVLQKELGELNQKIKLKENEIKRTENGINELKAGIQLKLSELLNREVLIT